MISGSEVGLKHKRPRDGSSSGIDLSSSSSNISSSSSNSSSLFSLFSNENLEKSRLSRESLEARKKEDAEVSSWASALPYIVEYSSKSRSSIDQVATTLDQNGLAILLKRKKKKSSDNNVEEEEKVTKLVTLPLPFSSSSSLSSLSQNSSIIPRDLLKTMLETSERIEEVICSRLEELKIETQISRLYKQKVLNDVVKPPNYKFKEVSSRCLGRLDVRYGMQEAPFNDPRLVESPVWLPLVHSLLGSDCELKYCGLIYSFPGSVAQPFHGDGPHLFGNNFQCPIHALNVFIPLHDIHDDLGPTEFVAGSHELSAAKEVNEFLKTNGTISKGNKIFTSVSPLLKAGSVLLYDYRTIHRGTANTSANKTRHMFYMLYTKPWFNENINFGDISIFSEEAKSLLASTTEEGGLVAKHEDKNSCGYCNIDTM